MQVELRVGPIWMTGTKGALCHFSSSATHVYMLKVSITVIPPYLQHVYVLTCMGLG